MLDAFRYNRCAEVAFAEKCKKIWDLDFDRFMTISEKIDESYFGDLGKCGYWEIGG